MLTPIHDIRFLKDPHDTKSEAKTNLNATRLQSWRSSGTQKMPARPFRERVGKGTLVRREKVQSRSYLFMPLRQRSPLPFVIDLRQYEHHPIFLFAIGQFRI